VQALRRLPHDNFLYGFKSAPAARHGRPSPPENRAYPAGCLTEEVTSRLPGRWTTDAGAS